jgi:nicotinate phosphoribosyltransferase
VRVKRTGLATDRYELTMVEAALRSGVAHRQAVFEVFTRRLPPGRRYGVVAGVARLIEAIEQFRFTEADIVALQQLPENPMAMSAEMAEWLLNYRFRGDIVGYAEGELFAAFSPILTVVGTFADAVVLETIVLSILNHDCAIAAAASVMVEAAQGRTLIEMGTRRTDPDAAVAAARAAIIAGFAFTSNLEAGVRYGVPTAGTAAHAFTLAHATEADAFRAQLAAQGVGTTLLVDTYDTQHGLRTAVQVAHEFGATGPGAVRIDSGDLVLEAKLARSALDELGATTTKVVLSGDLNAQTITEILAADAPVDVFGVGTSVVTGDGHPTASLAYKLVSIEDVNGNMCPVAKRSVGKLSVGGRKTAHRIGACDVITLHDDALESERDPGRSVMMSYIADGVSARQSTVPEAARRLADSLAELGSATLTSRFEIGQHGE